MLPAKERSWHGKLPQDKSAVANLCLSHQRLNQDGKHFCHGWRKRSWPFFTDVIRPDSLKETFQPFSHQAASGEKI
jgi:hypothetical protein